MLHACPALDKLAEKRMRPPLAPATKEILSSLASSHLKKVVEPPEPYSRTSMSGFRIEHINSTPPLSNITVLRAKQGLPDQNISLEAFFTVLEIDKFCKALQSLHRILSSCLIMCA